MQQNVHYRAAFREAQAPRERWESSEAPPIILPGATSAVNRVPLVNPDPGHGVGDQASAHQQVESHVGGWFTVAERGNLTHASHKKPLA